MHLRLIVLYLNRNLSSSKAIHGDVIATFVSDTMSYATVTRWLREVAFVSAVEEPPKSPVTTDRDEVHDAILLALAEQLFASVQDLSHLTHILQNSMDR
jgi:hypothetical protein